MSGILFGFGAAFFQSISYLCSKLYLKRHADDIGTLLILSHIVMGAISLIFLLYLRPADMPPLRQYALALFGTAGFYLLGQSALFAALVKTEASRVSPLLGLKIVILAVISVTLQGRPMVFQQWLAVAFCTMAALLLSHSGKHMRLSSGGFVLLACLFYSFSDLNIRRLVEHFNDYGILTSALLGTSLTYILCGIAALPLLAARKRVSREAWGYALPFALSWLIAMVFLFSCFALIGVVFGNIIQSTRGLISILMGVLVSQLGLERLEPRITRAVLVRRMVAACLMTAAVMLYYR